MSARMVGEPRVELSRAALHLALARSFELPEAEGAFCGAAAFGRFQVAAFKLRREAWRGFLKLSAASAEVAWSQLRRR